MGEAGQEPRRFLVARPNPRPGPHPTPPPADPEVVTEDLGRFEVADVVVGGGGCGVVGVESVCSSRSATSLAGRMETGIRALMCSPTC